MSPLSSSKAEKLGYKNYKVFQTGMPSWKKSKRLVLSEASYLMGLKKNDRPHVLVDLRDAATAGKGHIKGAIAIAPADLAGMKDKFPVQKNAPIILYSPSGVDVNAFKTVRGWGYKNTTVLRGGLQGWKKAEGRILTGELPTKIVYVKKLKPTQVGAEEFRAIVDGKPADKLVLDVREGTSPGVLAGAKVIPQSALASSLDQLPKDKEIIIHCNTGILAAMAQKDLQEKGFKSRYLDAVLQVSADGSYEITEK